jgi:hypothetical protein
VFVEEVAKAVLEAARPLWQCRNRALAAPPTLHASLMARLERLGVFARRGDRAGIQL